MDSHKKLRIFLIVLVIIVTCLLCVLGLSKLAFDKIFLRRETRWPDLGSADEFQYEILTEAYQLRREEGEKVIITAPDGVELAGHYYERDRNAPVIIFFHGLWGNGYTNGVPIYRITKNRGWNLLLVSLRAHDESSGNITTLGVKERYDCQEWARWVVSRVGKDIPIFLMGLSFGGAIALMSSDLSLPDSVSGIIDDCGFTTPLDMIRINSKEKLKLDLFAIIFTHFVDIGAKLWGGFDLREANATLSVFKTDIPLLIIHGENDKLAPVSMAYEIYNSCTSSNKQLYIVPGSEHANSYKTNPEEYERVISEFIERIIQ